ncbi:hypothetical protein BMS3Bbin04_00528 [bacterium BMS3Bbin04]|nr:hypothetical protein BMS3Bbin04_00528 [bacterium BMS3Bbin04]
MKRVMVFSLTGLLVLALVGLVMAESWDLRCAPGEVEEDDISGIVAGQPSYNGLKHKIECHVDNGIWDTAHGGWINDGITELFRREVSLYDNTTDLVYDRITLPLALTKLLRHFSLGSWLNPPDVLFCEKQKLIRKAMACSMKSRLT